MEESIIEHGKLQKSREPFEIRLLAMKNMDEILLLQEVVRQTVTQSDSLQPLSEEEFENILSGNGFMIGIYVKENLIAFRAMLIPPVDDPEHLGSDAGLTDEAKRSMMYSEISVVHPEFRGNGLQTQMGKVVMEKIDKSRFRYVATTVAPFNIPSLKDKIALGMKIIALKEKYNGKLRYVLFRDFKAKRDTPAMQSKTVGMPQTEVQQQLLQEGYRGISIQASDEKVEVIYSK
ncbi:GNAT family N-acetyltransferase [Virgibacillus halodenitrificans]|uniref:GNAT family N-acetyltransferase n=1 Tax=Virgibacillus halodenitrificans TaxID=1482 RepID=UPI001F2AC723|nr:GNAT family N-acetyltransferase [Virgibacillus halodenitrificans]MCG1028474.1 GNAT family N-acetyltransferase [Virgibacillus halodenitrificans]